MFKIYQKYIIKNFLKKFLKVTLVFLSLVYILGLLEEINFFKDLNESFILPYFMTLLNVPITLFEIFPFIFFIATQLFLYDFFKNKELDLLKKSGVNNIKIISVIVIISVIIGVFNVFIYYNVASKLKFYYSDVKNKFSNDNKYLAMVTESGLWIKDEINDKKYIIKSNSIKDDFLFENVINEFNSDFELVKTIQSNKIDISTNNWLVYNPTTTIDNISKEIKGIIELPSNFNSEKINNLFSNISSFDLFKLYDLKNDYEKFGYSTIEINIQLLRLYTTPIFYGILSILSVVIMLNFIKNKPLLFHLICGVMLSVIIYYINFIFNSLGINGKIPLNLSILFPFFLMTIFSLIGLIKINEK